jgi:hypothetical protein
VSRLVTDAGTHASHPPRAPTGKRVTVGSADPVGNVLGGVALVACLNHAQVVAGGGGGDVWPQAARVRTSPPLPHRSNH